MVRENAGRRSRRSARGASRHFYWQLGVPNLQGMASRPAAIAKVARADSASDQCTPIRLPSRPTEMPLKARRPRLDMLNRPMTRPRLSGGALSWTRLCAMALKDNSRNPAANRKQSASG